MTKSLTDMLKEFHDTFKVDGVNPANVPFTDHFLNFRGQLLGEEFQELFSAHIGYAHVDTPSDERQKHLTELLDALADIIYVCAGTAQLMGWDIQGAIEEVHASNMSKLDANGEPMFSDGTDGKPVGKILKSELFKEPKLDVFVEHIDKFITDADEAKADIAK